MQFAALLIVLGIRCSIVTCKTTLSLDKTVVFGPGVNPKQGQLPLTVIYIQARDEDGNKFSVIALHTIS